MFRFPCPYCHKSLKAFEEFAGKACRCTRCHARIVVPHPPQPDLPSDHSVLLGLVKDEGLDGTYPVENHAGTGRVVVFALSIVGVGLAIWGWMSRDRVVMYSPVIWTEPATIRDLVVRLEKSGMKIDVIRYRGDVWIFPIEDRMGSNYLAAVLSAGLWPEKGVIVERLDDLKMGEKRIGEMVRGKAYGHYWFSGAEKDNQNILAHL